MNAAILLSGGKGTRLRTDIPKQYLRVREKMIITYSLCTLLQHKDIHAVVVVLAPEWEKTVQNELKYCHVDDSKIMGFVPPGETRQLSVVHGLEAIRTNTGLKVKNVLVHDAARPNLTAQMIEHCLEGLREHDGVMPALEMKDTVYFGENEGKILKLIDRNNIFAGQAPEAFRFEKYYQANKRLGEEELRKINGSTEPAIIAGMDVVMIPGDENNFKITTETDLRRFEEIYS